MHTAIDLSQDAASFLIFPELQLSPTIADKTKGKNVPVILHPQSRTRF